MSETPELSAASDAHGIDLDMLMQKVLEMTLSKVSERINDLVQKAVDKAVKRPSSSIAGKQTPESSVVAEPQTGIEDVVVAADEEDNDDESKVEEKIVAISRPVVCCRTELPRPYEEYILRLGSFHDYMLGYYKNSYRLYPASKGPAHAEERYCTWMCEERDGWLCFENAGQRGRYLALGDKKYQRWDGITAFCLAADRNGHLVLKTPVAGSLYELTVQHENHPTFPYGDWSPSHRAFLDCAFDKGSKSSWWSFENPDV